MLWPSSLAASFSGCANNCTKLPVALTLAGVSIVSLALLPVCWLLTCQVVMLTCAHPAAGKKDKTAPNRGNRIDFFMSVGGVTGRARRLGGRINRRNVKRRRPLTNMIVFRTIYEAIIKPDFVLRPAKPTNLPATVPFPLP